jgi:hypothetical protein
MSSSRSRLFRWLIRLFPEDTRTAHGDEMLQILRQQHHETPRDSASRLRFWTAALFDVLRSAPRQHAEALRQDVSYALRGLARAPAFAATALVTIALATGATSAIFAIVNAVLLRPLPYRDPDRIALV